MVLSPEIISNYSVWLVNIIYFIGLFPQIYLNYKLKTVKGISNLMLVTYVFGYINYWYHILFSPKNFPMAYQVMVPMGMLGACFMVFQSFYYNRLEHSRLLLMTYIWMGILALFVLPFGIYNPDLLAKICGWVYFFVSFVYVLPQGVKMYQEKSVKGFSFWFVTFMTLGIFIEFFAAMILGLSKPIILNALRGLLVYVVFCMFYFHYQE